MELAVVITRHNEEPELLQGCLECLSRQEGVELEVHVMDQMGDKCIERLVTSMNTGAHRFHYHAIDTFSLSRSRNTGISCCSTRNIAFIDPDCYAEPGWAEHLCRAVSEPGRAIAGGRVEAEWLGRRRWYHSSNYYREMLALVDFGDKGVPVERVLGANFSIDRDDLDKEAPFDERLGRSGGRLLGGEETDLCEWCRNADKGVWYEPRASVRHLIPADRMRLRYICRHSFYQGLNRALRGGVPRPLYAHHRKLSDLMTVLLFSPAYLSGLLWGKVRGRSV